ncbi:hypothetical protein DSO57_1024948 [Entomophthora muscae]|uniref:Uncharacterized protein n=1 Tax=Entomophthora muscae TaxID=34485 RepID=A0ACC2RH64_9FUNG|nr:hypothetical protein DSO57_1024948 [Entomophthora muscae]
MNAYFSDYEQLVEQLNEFSSYSFDQLQQVAAHVACGLLELHKEVAHARAISAAFIAKLPAQVDKLYVPKMYALPSPFNNMLVLQHIQLLSFRKAVP